MTASQSPPLFRRTCHLELQSRSRLARWPFWTEVPFPVAQGGRPCLSACLSCLFFFRLLFSSGQARRWPSEHDTAAEACSCLTMIPSPMGSCAPSKTGMPDSGLSHETGCGDSRVRRSEAVKGENNNEKRPDATHATIGRNALFFVRSLAAAEESSQKRSICGQEWGWRFFFRVRRRPTPGLDRFHLSITPSGGRGEPS